MSTAASTRGGAETLLAAGELPEGWISTKLGVAVESMKNGLYKPASEYADHGVACLRMYNIDGGKIVWKAIKRMILSPAEVQEYGLAPGDLLVNRVNSRELVGKTAVIPKEIEACVYESKNIRVRLITALVNSDFVNYRLLLLGQGHFNFNSQQVVGMASISQPQIADFPLLLPPRFEQERIISKAQAMLAVVDETCARIARAATILRSFRQAVLSAACSGKLTEDWRQVNKTSAWTEVYVRDAIQEKPRNGLSIRAVKRETPVRVLTLTATTSGYFDGEHYKYLDINVPADSHLWLKKGDILLQRGNTQEYVGVPAFYDGEDNAYIYPDLMIKIRPREGVLARFLWITLASQKTRQYFRENATGSQGSMPKINQQIVENTIIPLPSTLEQHEIVRRVEALFKLADAIEKRVAAASLRAERLTQAVLAKAFRGELVPTEAELARREGRTYEPASALLERIKAERATASENGTRTRTKKTKK